MLSLLFIGASATHAQDSSMYNLPIQQQMDTMLLSNSLYNMMAITETDDAADTGARRGRDSQARGAQQSRNAQAQTRAAERRRLLSDPSRTTTFRPLDKYLAPSEMAKKYGKNPEDRARLEQMFTKDMDNYITGKRRNGGNPYDLARVMTDIVWFDYYILTDKRLSDAQTRGVISQMRELVLLDNDVQKMSDRERQFYYEHHAISAISAVVAYDLSKKENDTRAQEEARRWARKRMQMILGAPLERINFTAQGAQFK